MYAILINSANLPQIQAVCVEKRFALTVSDILNMSAGDGPWYFVYRWNLKHGEYTFTSVPGRNMVRLYEFNDKLIATEFVPLQRKKS